MVLATGISGELRAGYQVAAWLGRWEMAMSDDRLVDGRWTCRAELLARNDYWLEHAQRFALCLDVGVVQWCWPEVRVQVGDEQLTIYGLGGPAIV